MAEADLPLVIALALGAAAVGAPEALALLLDAAAGGRNPAADIFIAVFLIATVTSLVLGTVLLTRYVRVAAGANETLQAQRVAAARFARVTLAVALAVAVFATACLLAVPSPSAPTVPARELNGAATSCSASQHA